MKKVLIIGGGLAGIAIAERLTERDIDFHVIDRKDRPSSTSIATGIFNPIVFRRINKSWMVDDLIPELLNFYGAIGDKLGKEYLRPLHYAKRIPSTDYSILWNKRRGQQEYEDYLSPITEGFGRVLHAGMMDSAILMDDYRIFLENQGRISNEDFLMSDLDIHERHVTWKGITYDHAIFCEGPFAEQNQLWNWMPFNICKGEWVIIKTENEVCSIVLNDVLNIIPLGGNRYKLSSTFRWNDRSWESTMSAERELCDAFESLFDSKYEVVERAAGLRPTVADRRPYLGRHPQHSSISIFNGLGSKGVMLAPYFSDHLIKHLIDEAPLIPDVDIQRHIKRYRNSLLISN